MATDVGQGPADANARASILSKPAGCPKVYDRKTWLDVARDRVYDGRWRATRFELKTLARVGHCQKNPKVKPGLRKLRQALRASHLERMWSQGVGKLNRVFAAHGLFERGEFLRFTTIRRVFEAAGATVAQGYEFATIARGESGGGRWGGFPGILGIDGWVVPGATSIGIGLTQNTPDAWCDPIPRCRDKSIAWQYLYKLGGVLALRNPFIGARMSLALRGWAGGYSPWFGTDYFQWAPAGLRSALTAADRRWLKLGGMSRLRTR
jgi:hypothetical protein